MIYAPGYDQVHHKQTSGLDGQRLLETLTIILRTGTVAGWRWTGLRGRLMPLVLTVWSSILQFIRQVILLTTATTVSPSAGLLRAAAGADL